MRALLKLLSAIQGKFLLSSYRNKTLAETSKQHGWYTEEIKMMCSMTNRYTSKRDKIEVLTANYPITAVEKKEPT